MDYWGIKPNRKRKSKQSSRFKPNSTLFKPISVRPIKYAKPNRNSNSNNSFRIGAPRKPTRKISFIKPIHMTPPTYLRKESLIQKRALNPWGDVDLDGSPNQFDCNPFNPAEDGFMDVMRSIGSGIKSGASKIKEAISGERHKGVEYKTDVKYKRPIKEELKEKWEEAKRKSKEKKSLRRAQTLEVGSSERIESIGKLVGESNLQLDKLRKIKDDKDLSARERFEAEHKLMSEKRKIEKGLKNIESGKIKKTLGSIPIVGSTIQKALGSPEKSVARYQADLQRYRIEKKLQAGKIPTDIEISNLITREERTEKERSLRGSKIKKAILSPLTKQYTQVTQEKGKRISKAIGRTAAGLLLPGGVISKTKRKKIGGGRGRPIGPSGKYTIPGKGAVYVGDYRKWVTKQIASDKAADLQRNLQRELSKQRYTSKGELIEDLPQEEFPELPEEQIQQRITPQQLQQMQMQQMQQQQMQQQQMQQQQMPQRQAGGNILNAPNIARGEMVRQTPQGDNILNAPNIARGEMQNQAPMQDNILNAPNINRGEMRTQSMKSDNILNAPNINRGEMQNVQPIQQGPTQTTRLGGRPQTNPYGQEYVDIDPMSGREILRKRISEKFMTGEAL